MTSTIQVGTLVIDAAGADDFSGSHDLTEDLRAARHEVRHASSQEDLKTVGAKSSGLATTAEVIVTLSPVYIPAFLRVVRLYLERQKSRTVRLTVDGDSLVLDAASRKNQDQAIEAWIQTHASSKNLEK